MTANSTVRAATTAAYKKFIEQYQANPVGFAQNCLSLEPLEWQVSVMMAAQDALVGELGMDFGLLLNEDGHIDGIHIGF